ncbi:MAG: four helix bundle protein [Saprospiraceae bacterium]|nr:four helix bundle protein [Saprospiraceae bacterium]
MNQDLKKRTQDFAISVIKSMEQLPFTSTFKVINNQILRSSTSVGANYRAARCAKSTADFINKLKIVEEELDETMYWLEIIRSLLPEKDVVFDPIYKESNELLAIIVTAIKKARSNQELKK